MTTTRTGKPIVIMDYDPAWVARFERERDLIYATCGRDAFVRIEHVGSTAVPDLAAKAIIDLMPGLRSLDDAPPIIARLATIGYQYAPEAEHPDPSINDPGMPFRRYLRKDVDGERAFHMHMVEVGSEFWRNHLIFRNFLRTFEEEALAYADLKRRLAGEYNTKVSESSSIYLGYTDHKTDFIEDVLRRARERIAGSTPMLLVPYDVSWPEQFAAEGDAVAQAFGDLGVAVEHVGSTAVPGLASKMTVDIAVGMRDMARVMDAAPAMAALGYRARMNFGDWAYFDRRDAATKLAYHVHGVPHGGERWQRYLDFRDYLRAHPLRAEAYAALKYANAAEFGADRLGYVEGKSEFVRETERLARAWRAS